MPTLFEERRTCLPIHLLCTQQETRVMDAIAFSVPPDISPLTFLLIGDRKWRSEDALETYKASSFVA